MNRDALQQLIDVLAQALAGLGFSAPAPGLERIADCVHRSLTSNTRNFHTREHVWGMLDPDRPLQSLAALFHDLVYYQVDRGFCAEAYELFSPYMLEIPDGRFQVRQAIGDDRPFGLALAIFDLQPGQVLTPSAGLNEFLSALVMSRMLADYLPEKELLKLMVYIEASIPFRGIDTPQSGPCAALADRLKRACTRYAIQMDEAEQVETIQGAALFANRDVDNFSTEDPVVFLNHTWRLLVEMNQALWAVESYTVSEYRQAVQHMAGFLCKLDPAAIFRHYRGVPPQAELRQMQLRAVHNVSLGCQYLQIKLLAVTLLEALAIATGGDAPAASLLRELRGENEFGLSLDDFLPRISPVPDADLSAPVFQLLNSRKVSHLDLELDHSPFSVFLYQSLGLTGIQQHLDLAYQMFSGHLSAEQFLSRADAEVVSTIARACAALVLSRSAQFERFIL